MNGASDDDDEETLSNVDETSPSSDADETPDGADETPEVGADETPEVGADETPESADETSPDDDANEAPAGTDGGGGGRLAAVCARVLSALDSEIEAVRVVGKRAEEEEKPCVCESECECVREFASMVAPPQLPEPGATISLLAAWAAVPAAAPRLPDAEHAEPGQHMRDAIDTGALPDAEESAREPGDVAAGICSKCSRTCAHAGWAAAELPRHSSSPEGAAEELHLCPGRAPPCPPQANMALSSTLSKRYSFSGCALTYRWSSFQTVLQFFTLW